MKRLVIVADGSVAAHGVRMALRQTSGFHVVGFIDGRRPAAATLAHVRPDVVIVDDMPEPELAAARLREAAVSSPSLLRLLMRYVQQDIAFSEQSVACNALHGATARLARWLLVTQDRVDSTKIPLTQEYLAIMIGVQRTTATASALALKSAGLIRYMRGKIEILDRAGLEAAACECYWAGAAGQARSTSERRGASAMTSAAVSRRRAAAKEEAAVG